MKAPNPSKSGSALLITLLVTSLLLATALAFVAQVRLEFRSTLAMQSEDAAKRHARLAVELALAQLQFNAGPDQRATATAAFLGTNVHDHNRHWTGVWDTTHTNATPVWLITNTNPDPALPPANPVFLLDAGTLGPDPHSTDRVRASRIPLQPQPRAPGGHYAFWVADEGVKISLGKWNRLHELSSAEAPRLAQTTPGRTRNEWLLNGWNPSAAGDHWSDLSPGLARTGSRMQLNLIDTLDAGELRNKHHQITWNHFGVLANPLEGGLKRDLSYTGTSSHADAFMQHPSTRAWISHRAGASDQVDIAGLPAATPQLGDPAFTRPLVLTEFALYVGFFRQSAGSNNLRAQIAVRADVWNPHSFPMRNLPRGTPDLIFEISGLPEHDVHWLTAQGHPQERSGSFPLDLDTLAFRHNTTNNTTPLNRFEIDLFNPMAVGEVRTIVERAQAPLAHALTGDATPGTVQDDFIWTLAPPSELSVTVRTPDGALVQRFTALPIPAFDTSGFGHNLVSRNAPSYSEYQFVYHFKYYDEVMNGSEDELSDLEIWSTRLDPRGLLMDFNLDPDLQHIIMVNDPALASVDNTLFMGRPEFFYGGSGTAARNYHRFFDLPAVSPVSVGALQHLQFIGRAPYSVGNPWGGALNQKFDRYHFSTIPQSGDTWTPTNPSPLPNPHLHRIDSTGRPLDTDTLRHPLSAANLLVQGAFNIHTTDPQVWMAVLGGLHLSDWRYRTHETNVSPINRAHVRNGIFRHAHGADRHYTHPFARFANYPEITQTQKASWYRDHWQPEWAAAYTVGMRELRDGSNADNINDLADLAEAITQRLRARGRPFSSLSELAGSGLLQEAIDHTRINTVDERTFAEARDDLNARLPINAPSSLSQADLLQLIAPIAQVRSDTFVIRAYGDAIDPNTGAILARAWCEVEVQRLPEPVDFQDPENPALVLEDYLQPPGTLGRRFVIRRFQWLREDEV